MKALLPEWVIPVVPKGVSYRNCAVVVDSESGTIKALVKASELGELYPGIETLDLPERVLLPGLVDAHTHQMMLPLRGLANDQPLEKWLFERILPTESKVMDPPFIEEVMCVSFGEQLLLGTTTTSCFSLDPLPYVEKHPEHAGPRLVTGPSFYNSEGPTSAFWEKMPAFNHPLVAKSVCTHSAYLCSDEILRSALDVSQRHGFAHQIHMHETPSDKSIKRLHEKNLLHDRMVAGHCVHLDEEEMDMLAECGVSVAHCPDSNFMLGSGLADVVAMRKHGINVAIGTDAPGASHNLSMLTSMRLAAYIGKVKYGSDALTAHDVIYMATMGGAKAFKMEDEIGSIEVGKQADLVAIDLSPLSCQPVYNPASSVVYSDGARVESVWLSGKQVVKEGQLICRDHSNAVSVIKKWTDRVREVVSFEIDNAPVEFSETEQFK